MKSERPFEYIPSDTELLNRGENQEVFALEELYKIYWNPLLQFASKFLNDHDSCKEIVQGLFVHLHTRHQSLKITTAVRPYLYTSLRNRIFNYVRNRSLYKRHIILASSRAEYVSNDVEQFMDVVELNKKIADCLREMPVKYKEVYLLHCQGHFTVKKIAFILNRPVDTVEKQLRKAKAILRNYLLLTKDN